MSIDAVFSADRKLNPLRPLWRTGQRPMPLWVGMGSQLRTHSLKKPPEAGGWQEQMGHGLS